MVGELWTPGGTVTAQKEHARPTTQGPTEREARRVAEAARQTEWTKPSFGKELFLGRFRLDLVDPWPTPSPEARAKGEESLALGPSLRRRGRPGIDEVEAEASEEQLLAKARFGPLGLTGRFGDPTRLALGGALGGRPGVFLLCGHGASRRPQLSHHWDLPTLSLRPNAAEGSGRPRPTCATSCAAVLPGAGQVFCAARPA